MSPSVFRARISIDTLHVQVVGRRLVLRQRQWAVVIIPLTVCMPNEVSAIGSSGTSVAFEVDTADGYACKDASVLVFATVVSAGISAIAALIYLYKDVRSLPEKGTLNMSFLLLQAGIVLASLLREVYFWQTSYQTAYDSMGLDYTVRFPSSMALPTISCAFAFASILVLALRKGYIVFFGGKTDDEIPIAQSVTAKVSTKLPSLKKKMEVPVAEPVVADSGSSAPEWAKV